MISPSQTRAVIVGIGSYDASKDWHLPGPAEDACRFASWLLAKGVAAANIALFLSYDELSINLPEDISPRTANQESIHTYFTEELRLAQEDFLIVFWGGHGVIKPDNSRLLFYQDATIKNKRNLNFNELMTFLRSDYFPVISLKQQLLVIDTCANHEALRHSSTNLPMQGYPDGKPSTSREQFALLGAKTGDYAINLNNERTGAFSKAFFQLLESHKGDTWFPDFKELALNLAEHFVALRQKGHLDQTPSHYWFRSFDDVERTLGDFATPASQVVNTVTLSPWDKRLLSKAILACPAMNSILGQENVLKQLPTNMRAGISYSDRPDMYAYNILDRCLGFNNGFSELFNTIAFFDEDQDEFQNLKNLAQSYGLFGNHA